MILESEAYSRTLEKLTLHEKIMLDLSLSALDDPAIIISKIKDTVHPVAYEVFDLLTDEDKLLCLDLVSVYFQVMTNLKSKEEEEPCQSTNQSLTA